MLWTTVIAILIIDVYIESFFGKNILGYQHDYGRRIVSFFKDEPIVGGFLNAFFLIIIGYLFNLISKTSIQYKNVILFFSIIFIFAILLTGERSNSIKALIGFLSFYFFNDFFRLKQKFLSLLLLISLIGILLNVSDFLKLRYGSQFLKPIASVFQSKEEINPDEPYRKNLYHQLYESGFSVFKKYPIFGVGNKNYRVEACKDNKPRVYICTTHPHQIYFEFLSEHGLIGSIILLFIIFNLIFRKTKNILMSQNYIQIGCLLFFYTSFIPFLPSGAFFTDYNLTIFWINLSVMYAVSKKTNIFV